DILARLLCPFHLLGILRSRLSLACIAFLLGARRRGRHGSPVAKNWGCLIGLAARLLDGRSGARGLRPRAMSVSPTRLAITIMSILVMVAVIAIRRGVSVTLGRLGCHGW